MIIASEIEAIAGDAATHDEDKTSPAWARALLSPKVFIGLAIVLFFVLAAAFGPVVDHTDPNTVTSAKLQGPSLKHLLGTTQQGQDVLAQLLYGARVSMIVGFAAGVLTTVWSVVVGLTGGYVAGATSEALSMFSNIFLVIPSLPLVVILASFLPNSGPLGIIIVITVTGWAWGARVLRAQTLSLRRRDFVEAARATGEHPLRIMFYDILTNEVAIVAATFVGSVIFAILTEASIAFLGLSSVTQWSWGTMLYWAQVSGAELARAWWWFVPPGLCIALVGTGLAFVNFGIDDFINPRLRMGKAGRRRARLAGSVRSRSGARGANGAPSMASGALTAGRPALEVTGLTIEYGGGHRSVQAVNNVSFTLHRGEVLGIAGESGSGKSTFARAVTRLLRPPGEVVAGSMVYTSPQGAKADILALNERELQKFRWEEIAIVFQSAMNALNPVLRLRAQMDDVLRAHRPGMDKVERNARIVELLQMVGISADRANAYPHELSGGMRQRAMIAMGLALDPEIIVMDEPTTALDVVIQRQIVETVIGLKESLGFSVVFITHDLSLLIELCDTIAVMYAGRVVEVAPAEEFYRSPKHPYSQGLLASFPTLSGPRKELVGIPGSPPDMRRVPPGCPFHPRCPAARASCQTAVPPLLPLSRSQGDERVEVACVLYNGETADGLAVMATHHGGA